jgi:hypothetical protein
LAEAGEKTVLAQVSQFPFLAVFFNDIQAEEGGKAVFVSEMGRRDIIRDVAPSPNAGHLMPVDTDFAYGIPATSRIYRITMDGAITSVLDPSRKLLVINGVIQTKKHHLLATDFFHGNIVDVDMNKNTKSIIATAFRGADGLAQGCDGTIYVSSFENGNVWRMDENGENPRELFSGGGFQSTADFYLDEAAHMLYVPSTRDGTVIFVPTE